MFNKEELKRKIVDLLIPVNPIKIILFGSYAYGKPTEGSDVDICIVEESISSKVKEAIRIRELLKLLHAAVDILVPSREEFDFYKKECCSVYKEINDKGEILWQRNS